MAFQPLTREQYQKALDSGYSPEKIIEFEKRRKAESQNILPGQNQQKPQQNQGFWGNLATGIGNLATGIGSGLVSSATDILGMAAGGLKKAAQTQPTYGIKPLEKIKQAEVGGLGEIADIEKDVSQKFAEQGKSLGLAGKAGYYGEKVGEFAIPIGATEEVVRGATKIPEEMKALKLSVDELKNINAKKLQWLSKDALSEGETIGGILKSKAYAMPKKMEGLANEFKDILKGSPEEIRAKAANYGKSLYKKTLDLFEGSEKAINENTVRTRLTEALNKDLTTTYASEYEKADVTKKAIDGFINSVEKGTNKGLEEARMNWYAKVKNVSGKLSDANTVIHNAIKNVIKDSLPEEKQAIYDAYKQTMAKSYDIEEIMKAKIKTAVKKGGSLLKTAGKVATGLGIAGGIGAGYEKVRGLFGK